MADFAYRTYPNTFQSRGIAARPSDDTLQPGEYLNLDNCEEQAENTMCSRLGSMLVNRSGAMTNQLPGGTVHSLAKLLGLNDSAFRYAGCGTTLFRRIGATQGAYSVFDTGLSGQQWSSISYRPTLSSFPYLFIADAAKMMKDNGSFAIPQQWGIFQPQFPALAQVIPPEIIDLSAVINDVMANSYVNITGVTSNLLVNTTTTTAIVGGQINTVTPVSMDNIFIGSLIFVSSPTEEIFVLNTTPTTFTASFGNSYAPGATVTSQILAGTVAAATTATITFPVFPLTMPNLGIFINGTKTQGADYFALAIMVANPNNIQQINLLFDCGDGTFTQDYFLKTIQPAIDQALISGTETPQQAATNAVFSEALGITNSAVSANPSYLNTGDNVFTYLTLQMDSFVGVGNASPTSPSNSWSNVNSLQIQIITNTNGPAMVSFTNFALFGGFGPNSFGGVAYDYLYTYFNANTGAESNPSIFMSSVIPTTTTTFFPPRFPLPQRQPILVNLVASSDPQVTNIRIYRRGGSLSSNFFRLDQIPPNMTTYIDIIPDAMIEGADTVSLVNDVPVTSTLPVPVNTILTANLNPVMPGALLTITPVSMQFISVAQQVTLGGIADPNNEVVIVVSITLTTFTAFVQNPHLAGDPVTAQAAFGSPCNLAAVAYNAAWLAGDPNNPHFLYFSTNFSPESFGSANFIEVGIPSDPINAIVPFQGSLYVGTRDHWYIIGPNTGTTPTVFPTSSVHGVAAPHGWVATETEIWHLAIDGIRTFAGSTSTYRSQEIEFLFQGGPTPIVEANPAMFNLAVMAYRNNIVFLSYIGFDGLYHRVMYHTIYKRFRNDDQQSASLYLEEDTNLLLYGDTNGFIHQDRIGTFDEEPGPMNTFVQTPIALNLQTAYMDQGTPKNQKNYQEVTLDMNTNGQVLNFSTLYNDGEITVPLGSASTTSRQKVNFNINSGLGQQAYRVSLQVTGNTSQLVTLYQVDIRGVELAETRQTFDTYWLKFGTDESKLAKQFYLEWNSTQPLTVNVYYDGALTPEFTTTLPAEPFRMSKWQRLPAVKFRLLRMIITRAEDFQIWQDSKFEVKPVNATKGYQAQLMMP